MTAQQAYDILKKDKRTNGKPFRCIERPTEFVFMLTNNKGNEKTFSGGLLHCVDKLDRKVTIKGIADVDPRIGSRVDINDLK